MDRIIQFMVKGSIVARVQQPLMNIIKRLIKIIRGKVLSSNMAITINNITRRRLKYL